MVGAEVICDEVMGKCRVPTFRHAFFSSSFEVSPMLNSGESVTVPRYACAPSFERGGVPILLG